MHRLKELGSWSSVLCFYRELDQTFWAPEARQPQCRSKRRDFVMHLIAGEGGVWQERLDYLEKMLGDSAALNQKITDLFGSSARFQVFLQLQLWLQCADRDSIKRSHTWLKGSKHVRVLSSSLNRHGLTEHSQQKHASVQDCAFHCISWKLLCSFVFTTRNVFQ